MEPNDDIQARLAVIDELLEPFIDGHGRAVDPLAAAVHELLRVVRDLSEDVRRIRQS